MPHSPSPRLSGALINGRFAIRRKLGSGSMGAVYLAQDTREKRAVALKVIRTDRLDADSISRLQQEFRSMVSLDHPQIARVYDFGFVEGTSFPFYTSEYVEGLPLPAGPPSGDEPREFLRPILDLLAALGYLHAHGILHLDIHAGNLILSNDARRGGVLIDFGVLRSLGAAPFPRIHASWTAMPPELVCRGKATPRSDLYLAARLLLFRLTGRSEGEARLPREIPGWGPRLTLQLERILQKGLQPSPSGRFESSDAFRDALLDALGESSRSVSEEAKVSDTSQRAAMETLGRDAELSEIEATFEELGSGRPGILWYSGGKGMGKTRLAEEARVRAQLRGLNVVDVAFSDLAQEPLLARRLRLGERKGPRPPAWLAPLAMKHGGTPLERARRAAESFFHEQSDPLVLILDDIDFARDESRMLLEALVEETLRFERQECPERALCLLMTSSGTLPGSIWAKFPRKRRHSLKPLRSAHARKLLRCFLEPRSIPAGVERRALELGHGSPRRIRQVAGLIEKECRGSGVVPETVELPDLLPVDPGGALLLDWDYRSPAEREVLAVLAAARRGVRLEEITAAAGKDKAAAARAVRQLVADDLAAASGRGAHRDYLLAHPDLRDEIRARLPEGAERKIHERLARVLTSRGVSHPLEQERLARHFLALGRREEARELALRVSSRLARRVSCDSAIRLLEEVMAGERSRSLRLKLAQEMSRLLQETGDHEKGIALLEPLYSGTRGTELPGEAVRVRRLLGIHFHRAGRVEEAKSIFEEAQRLADPERDLEDLIFIDSELAELHIFRASFGDAEEACRRGLDRIARSTGHRSSHGQMEMVLRASLGHLNLRKFVLDEARAELLRALALSRKHGTTTQRAAILGNLGITENQRNDFAAAREYFTRAERLLLESGDRRTLVQVSTNLAVLAAKLGDRQQAHSYVERAFQLTRRYPGRRLEFSVAYSRGIVSHQFGDAEECMIRLEEALELGRELGDRYLVGFGEVYLAEAQLSAGRYGDALKTLRATRKQAEADGPPVLLRMVHSRLFVVEALLGRSRSARRSWRVLEETPVTNVVLLEAWNDLFMALGWILEAEERGIELARRARRAFLDLKVPAGVAFAGALELLFALLARDEGSLRRLLGARRGERHPDHAFLAVVMPLLRAEGFFRTGDSRAAEEELGAASGAIIGSHFLELDWRVEILRSRLSLRRGDAQDARRHLHRCLHTKEYLQQLVPSALRKGFLSHPRFAALGELASRLDRSPRLHFSTEQMRRAGCYAGMVGASAEMLGVFQLVERIREEEVPVLIRGETGTGKELIARALHQRGLRSQKPFLALHCAALPVDLFESELFGYEAGAFTEAREDRPGLLESVGGGTLLLDEVGQLPRQAQGKLLQFLDSGTFRRLGGNQVQRSDVRILAATSHDLGEAVRRGTFREDLYYRLRGVEVVLPPLRDRAGDIPLLARHFVEKHAERLGRRPPSLTRDAYRALESYRWPGNVRELETVLLRVLLETSHDAQVGSREIEKQVRGEPETLVDRRHFEKSELGVLKTRLEKEYLTDLYLRCRGEPEAMMQALKVKRSRLYAWFHELGIDVRELRKQLDR